MKFKRPHTGHKSQESAFNGVASFIQLKFPNVIEKTNDPNKLFSQIRKLMIKYLEFKGIDHKTKLSNIDGDYNANLIQNDFKSFIEYLKTI